MIFTAMTRAKAWLRISGSGQHANAFQLELNAAKTNCPYIRFKYPTESALKIMRRDLKEGMAQRADRMLDELQGELPLQDYEDILKKRLANVLGRKIKNVKKAGKKPQK